MELSVPSLVRAIIASLRPLTVKSKRNGMVMGCRLNVNRCGFIGKVWNEQAGTEKKRNVCINDQKVYGDTM